MLEKTQHVLLLRDVYGPLLTDKQREAVALHFEEDWSLSEIALHLSISKQAVHDLLKRTVASLGQYESKLGFARREQLLRERLAELVELLQAGPISPGGQQELIDLIEQAGDVFDSGKDDIDGI